MNTRLSVLICVFLLGPAAETQASAYTGRDFLNDLLRPGRRQGLTFHVDVGLGGSRVTAEHDEWTTPKLNISEGGTGWTLGVGYAPLDQFIIQGTMRWFMCGENGPLGLVLGPIGTLVADEHLMAGIGASFYFRRKIPSWFLEAGVGGGRFASPFDDDTFCTAYSGPGFFTAVGYEFTRHCHFKVELMWSRNEGDRHSVEGRWTCATLSARYGFVYY